MDKYDITDAVSKLGENSKRLSWQITYKNLCCENRGMYLIWEYGKNPSNVTHELIEKFGDLDINYQHITNYFDDMGKTMPERIKNRAQERFILNAYNNIFYIEIATLSVKDQKGYFVRFMVDNEHRHILDDLYEIFKPYEWVTDIGHDPEIGFITFDGRSLRIRNETIKPNNSKIVDNYEGFDYEKLKELVEDEEKTGLILLHGQAGTGKTSLIKKLITDTDKEFVFLDNSIINKISDESFTNFIFDELKNKILILEDGENILMDRKLHNSPVVSTILNLSDGIKSDILRCKIIVTYNYGDNIDPALLRKGRLLADIEVKRLSVEKANSLMKSLGKKHRFTEPTTLADIYNWEDSETENVTNRDKQTIGFKK